MGVRVEITIAAETHAIQQNLLPPRKTTNLVQYRELLIRSEISQVLQKPDHIEIGLV